MKKLLQINSVANISSTGRIAEEIGQTAISKGWESNIAYGRAARESKSELIRIGNDWDNKLHGLQTRLLDNHGLASRKSTKAFIAEVNKIQPDIIHLHNIHGYYLNYKLLFKYLKSSNIPVIWTLHDCWPITGHCTYFDFIGCNKWQKHCFNCPQKKEYPASFLIDRSMQNFDIKRKLFSEIENITLVPVSLWLKDVLKKSFLSSKKIQVIHNGINNEVFKPIIKLNIQKKYNLFNKFVILGVANEWIPRKGFIDFIEIQKRLNEDFKIIIVGLNKDQLKLLPLNFIGIERTENINELIELYSACDVFLNPTYEDNFPTTNLEALACGTPVITYNTGGSPEAVDEETGIVVEKGDIDGLVSAIMEVKTNGKSHYTAKCRERAIKHFNKDDKYMEYIRIYEEILSNNNR